MIHPWLRHALVSTLLVVPSVAWAGGGGGSSSSGGESSGTDTGATDTGATDTGGTDSGSTGGSSSGGICNDCTPLDEPVQIVSPMDGDVVPPSLQVRVTAPHTCSCETMCCDTFDPFSINLRVDNMTVANCSMASKECNTRDQTFSIVLEPGVHILDAAAQVDGSPEFSAPIEVTVEGTPPGADSTGEPPPPPPPPPPPATGSDGGSSGTDTGAADGGGGGCGCRSAGGTGSLWLMVLALGAAIRRRR